jgi:putative ABC transport system permease protein
MLIDRDNWQEIWATISRNKLRTALTALGVFWGIFMLVFVLGMGAGLKNGVFRSFEGRANNLMYLWTEPTSQPFDGFNAGREPEFTIDDIEAIREQFPEVQYLAPRYSINGNVVYGGQSGSWQIRGELTDMIQVEALKLYSGRYINPTDIAGERKVAVIGDRIRQELFGAEDPIGRYVSLRGVEFLVVGVFGPIEVKPWNQEDLESVVVPLTTMYKTFGTPRQVDYFIVTAYPDVDIRHLEPQVKDFLRGRHHVAPKDPRGIGGFNLADEFEQFRNLFFGINGFLWFVGIGTLLAGVVSVGNIMLITVKERTREIGIRKALGATPASIVSMIMAESVLITFASGYLGLLLGTGLIWGIDALMTANGETVENFHHPEVYLGVGLSALVILILSGLIAGLVPATLAAQVNPVNALRNE